MTRLLLLLAVVCAGCVPGDEGEHVSQPSAYRSIGEYARHMYLMGFHDAEWQMRSSDTKTKPALDNWIEQCERTFRHSPDFARDLWPDGCK